VRLLRAVAGLRAVFREPGARLARSWLDGLVVKALAFVHLADGDSTHFRTTAPVRRVVKLQRVAAFASTGLRAPARVVPATVTILVFTVPPRFPVGAEICDFLLVVGFMGALRLVDALVAAAHFGRLDQLICRRCEHSEHEGRGDHVFAAAFAGARLLGGGLLGGGLLGGGPLGGGLLGGGLLGGSFGILLLLGLVGLDLRGGSLGLLLLLVGLLRGGGSLGLGFLGLLSSSLLLRGGSLGLGGGSNGRLLLLFGCLLGGGIGLGFLLGGNLAVPHKLLLVLLDLGLGSLLFLVDTGLLGLAEAASLHARPFH